MFSISTDLIGALTFTYAKPKGGMSSVRPPPSMYAFLDRADLLLRDNQGTDRG